VAAWSGGGAHSHACRAAGNSASQLGGAIYALNTYIQLGDVLFVGNRAVVEGGALYTASIWSVGVSSTRFDGTARFAFNSASSIGGAVHVAVFGGQPAFFSSADEALVFEGNEAAYGGALAISNDVEVQQRPREREGGREGGKKGGRDGWMNGGGMEGDGTEGRRDGGTEGRRDGGGQVHKRAREIEKEISREREITRQ
jgi:predicted outer membrane repeat protein